MKRAQHGRYDYAPTTDWPRFNWPQGKGLAVYLGVNLEHFAFGQGLGAELAPGGPQPDVLNYAWRGYGNQASAQPLVTGIALHRYIVGQPARLRHLRRTLAHICAHRSDIWLTRACNIADSFAAQISAPEQEQAHA